MTKVNCALPAGCYILRPWAYGVWEHIHSWFDGKIKAMGVKNAYFPIFITEESLNTEKDHVEGFAAEVSCMVCICTLR